MLIRQHFPDLLFTDALPALNAVIFDDGYKKFPRQWSQVFPVSTSTREIEQFTQISGLGRFRKLGTADAARVTYDEPVKGWNKTFTHEDWSLGFKASHQLIRDDKWSIIRQMGVELGYSAKDTLEEEVALHFNRGFDGAYPINSSGQPLFSLNHPLYKAGIVQANTLPVAVDLDHVSLQLALTACRRLRRGNGQKMRVPFNKLIVAPEGEWIASAILSGSMRHDTANNEVNTFRHRDGAFPSFRSFMVWDYLTDPDAWFLTTDPASTGLKFFWREKPYTSHDVDFDTRSTSTAMWYACSHGPRDCDGLFGVPGA